MFERLHCASAEAIAGMRRRSLARERHALAVNEPLAVQYRAVLEEVAQVLHDNVVRARVWFEAGLVEGEEALPA